MATTGKRGKTRRPPTKNELALGFMQFSKKLTIYVMAYWG